MKKIILTSLVLLFLNQLDAQTLYPTGTSGCIARWTFDSDSVFSTTISDVRGNNNNGTNNNISSVNNWKHLPNQTG